MKYQIKVIIDEVISLPVEERAFIADSVLKSITTPNIEIDQKWIITSKHRLNELRTGKVGGIPGEKVFAGIKKRFE